MGAYVNPKEMSKIEWLESNCIAKINLINAIKTSWDDLTFDNTLPVMLVDNENFHAAGIAYDEDEFKRFTRSDDLRPKIIYTCKVDDLLKVSSELGGYLNE